MQEQVLQSSLKIAAMEDQLEEADCSIQAAQKEVDTLRQAASQQAGMQHDLAEELATQKDLAGMVCPACH